MKMNHFKKGARENPSNQPSFPQPPTAFLSQNARGVSTGGISSNRAQPGTARTQISRSCNLPEALGTPLIGGFPELSGAANQQHDQCQGKGLSFRPPS